MQQLAPPVCGEHVHAIPHHHHDTPVVVAPAPPLDADSTAQHAVSTGMGSHGAADGRSQVIHCWACRTVVQLPLVPGFDPHNQPPPMFKCGWCGAVTVPAPPPRHPRPAGAFRSIMLMLAALKWGVPTMVVLLTLSITVPGAFMVLPHTHGSHLWLWVTNHIITWVLCSNILFNFMASTCCSPGTVRDHHGQAQQQAVPQGAYDNFGHCAACKFLKPPGAHHCSVCNTCVMNLDHHCPFINNCVGVANLRAYLLFLAWTLAAMLYCMLQSGILFVLQRQLLLQRLNNGLWSVIWANPWKMVLFNFLLVRSLPWHMLVALHMLVSALGVGLGVGILLFITVRNIATTPKHSPVVVPDMPDSRTESQGGLAKAPANVRLPDPLLERLQEVMGGRGPIQWLRPVWGIPKSVVQPAGESAKKRR